MREFCSNLENVVNLKKNLRQELEKVSKNMEKFEKLIEEHNQKLKENPQGLSISNLYSIFSIVIKDLEKIKFEEKVLGSVVDLEEILERFALSPRDLEGIPANFSKGEYIQITIENTQNMKEICKKMNRIYDDYYVLIKKIVDQIPKGDEKAPKDDEKCPKTMRKCPKVMRKCPKACHEEMSPNLEGIPKILEENIQTGSVKGIIHPAPKIKKSLMGYLIGTFERLFFQDLLNNIHYVLFPFILTLFIYLIFEFQ